jgi:hypothetical protein
MKQTSKSTNLENDKQLAKKLRMVDTWYWLVYEKIKLEFGDYELDGHEYQVDWLQCDFRKQVFKKAAQMTVTTTNILKCLHKMIYGYYKQGVLYLFPTEREVTDFSKGRFQPIISSNPQITQHVIDTDTANIKRIGNSMLYLRGARSSQKIGGIKATSSQLKGIPVDHVIFDEEDEMSPSMIHLALQRFSHSKIQWETHISTPSIPDYGVDRAYDNSDQRVREIKCGKCNTYTCLELEFPDCLIETSTGDVVKVCMKCKNEIYPINGQWVAQYPSRSEEFIGWWISQLNSKYIKAKTILDSFLNPPEGNLAEVYNSMLGMAYVSADNQLTKNDVYACCGKDAMSPRFLTPSQQFTTCMGIDVASKILHVIIGYPYGENRYKIVYIGRLPDFNAVHDIAQRYNVGCAVVDSEPETREVRAFQEAESYKVFLCDYQEKLRVPKKQDERQGLITVRRTEICDQSHNLVTGGKLELPRRNPEVEQYAFEMTNIAKVLEEDEFTGDKTYKYRKLGASRPDHYRHATNYFILACRDIAIVAANQTIGTDYLVDEKANAYDPFAYIGGR